MSWLCAPPEPLPDAAFHGIVGEYVLANNPHTESSREAVYAQALVLAGNAMGSSAHCYADSQRHACSENVLLVGRTSKARKGTSLANAKRLVLRADEKWAKTRIVGGLASGEGIVSAVRDVNDDDLGVEDKRLLIEETEFTRVLKVMGRQGNVSGEIIRQCFDGGPLQIMTKNTPLRCALPHVSIIAHVTRDELLSTLEADQVNNGFLNRFCPIFTDRSKKLSESSQLPREAFEPLVARLTDAIEFAKAVQLIERDQDARRLWDRVYGELSEGKPGLYGASTSRAEAHVTRFSVILALLDKSYWVRPVHLIAALALWDYVDASAKHIFGDSVGERIPDTILSAIRNTPEGLSRTGISVALGRNVPADRIEEALKLLSSYSRIEKVPIVVSGKKVEMWRAKNGTH